MAKMGLVLTFVWVFKQRYANKLKEKQRLIWCIEKSVVYCGMLNNQTMDKVKHLDTLIEQTKRDILDKRVLLDALYAKRDAVCDTPLNRNYIEDGIL
jgi:hypothetical protein|tara:strand:+ start:457 stop:747 length:291 start_codon:yes stop_codon:yes gene_type:complete